jgi:glyoxylase-like metal-dependent hydrolase (beta-lactamase superfamily II)
MTDQLRQITDHVWVYPHHPDPDAVQPCVGVVVTPAHTVLIDAGNGPGHARRLLSELWRIDAPPVSHIIYTHFHWDHTFGAVAFGDTVVIAHEQGRDLLYSHYGGRSWNRTAIQDEIRASPARARMLNTISRALEDWHGFRVVLPQVMFSDEMWLHLDGVTLQLRYVGGQHAADSITVQVVEDGALFIGDSYYPPPPPTRKPADTLDLALVESFLRQGMAWYIEGHNRPFTHADLSAQLPRMRGQS